MIKFEDILPLTEEVEKKIKPIPFYTEEEMKSLKDSTKPNEVANGLNRMNALWPTDPNQEICEQGS